MISAIFYSMVLIPRVLCYFGFGYFSHLCIAFVLSDSGVKWSSCLFSTFLPAFAWDAVDAVLCFLDFVFVSVLRSVVRGLNAIRILNIFPDSANFFRYP
jgi:hypothetical protein